MSNNYYFAGESDVILIHKLTVTGFPNPLAEVQGQAIFLPVLQNMNVVPRIGCTLCTVAIFTAESRAFLYLFSNVTSYSISLGNVRK